MKIGQNSDQTLALLQKVLDLRADKEKVIASNIANSETPGFRPSRLNFEKQLQHAMDKGSFSGETTHQNHIPLGPNHLEQVKGVVSKEQNSVELGDKNGVSLDEEMLALAENQLLYETAAQLLKKKLSIQKYVISGGQ